MLNSIAVKFAIEGFAKHENAEEMQAFLEPVDAAAKYVTDPKDFRSIRDVLVSGQKAATTIQLHRSQFQDESSTYSPALAHGDLTCLDTLKASKLDMGHAVDQVTSLEELSEHARYCTTPIL